MRLFDQYWPKPSIMEQMKARAKQFSGLFPPVDMAAGLAVVDACRAQYEQKELITLLAYTMDDGMHSSGWWKNPEYARCYHLSLSFWNLNETVAPKNEKETAEWVRLFFTPNERWVWAEPPYSNIGKRKGVWHYRLFADEHWQAILPHGEVYSTLKTERGWLSWSDVQDKLKKVAVGGQDETSDEGKKIAFP